MTECNLDFNNVKYSNYSKKKESKIDTILSPTASIFTNNNNYKNKQNTHFTSKYKKKYLLKKSNSTSSLYLLSTFNNPNPKIIINSISNIILSQILEDKQLGKVISTKSDLYIFSEEKYINEKNSNLNLDVEFQSSVENLKNTIPSVGDIFSFIEAIYICAQFSIECCILSLIYINRIIALTGLCLNNTNWRPLTLISLIISQKTWDDRYLCNSNFAYYYPFFETQQINILEMKFLEMIQYNLYVKKSLFVRYYLELKSIDDSDNNILDGKVIKPSSYYLIKKLESSHINPYDSKNKDELVALYEEEPDSDDDIIDENFKKPKVAACNMESQFKNIKPPTKKDAILMKRIDKHIRCKSKDRGVNDGKSSVFVIS